MVIDSNHFDVDVAKVGGHATDGIDVLGGGGGGGGRVELNQLLAFISALGPVSAAAFFLGGGGGRSDSDGHVLVENATSGKP